MKKTVSAMEARKHLGALLEDVSRGDEVVIERAGKAMGVVVSAHAYEQLAQARKESFDRLMALMERVHERNKDIPEEVIEAEIAAAIAEVRAENRARRSA